MEGKYEKIRQIVQKELAGSAHDMDHVMRVYNLCLQLAEGESDLDLDILKTAALLHDIARVKEDRDDTGDTDHAALGADMAGKILRELNYSEERIEQIQHCIIAHRFRSGTRPESKEAKILFDADKLDVLGGIGIARSFIVAGEYGERIYSDVPINEYVRENLVGGRPDGRIKQISRHAPNIEFELKFKHMHRRLHTQRAKEIAKARLEFMTQFFERLRGEIRGQI